jgi:hypothetical protein
MQRGHMLGVGKRGFAALGALYALSAAVLCGALPGPHSAFEYMVIGAGSTSVTLLAFFLGGVFRRRS